MFTILYTINVHHLLFVHTAFYIESVWMSNEKFGLHLIAPADKFYEHNAITLTVVVCKVVSRMTYKNLTFPILLHCVL